MRVLLTSTDTEGIGDTVDVIEPGRNQCDLKNRLVVESDGTKAIVVVLPYLGGILSELDDVVDHDPLLFGQGSLGVVRLEGFD